MSGQTGPRACGVVFMRPVGARGPHTSTRTPDELGRSSRARAARHARSVLDSRASAAGECPGQWQCEPSRRAVASTASGEASL